MRVDEEQGGLRLGEWAKGDGLGDELVKLIGEVWDGVSSVVRREWVG